MNNQNRKWEVLAKHPVNIINTLLKNRGIKAEKDREEFFKPTPPEKIGLKALGISQLEVSKTIKRLRKALRTKEKVIVYGDYDADGICGTAILWETLYSLGLDILPYIPERFSEGYGLNSESIKNLKLKIKNLSLIITVDHGIVAHKKIDIARELDIDVIITDHHQPGKTKPKPYALIHTTKIGGAAVAWVFAREVAKKFKIKNLKLKIANSLELVAIGTIADQLPLLGPNRSFAKYGLEALNKTKRAGLLALMDVAAIKKDSIGPYEVGFLIAPRLNAMGRLEHAMQSLRLLCIKNPSRAKEIAQHLNRTNLERQKIVDEVVVHARKSAHGKKKEGIIVLAHESYHEGVIGLAAAKLVEEFYRPAIVLSKKKDVSKASARSIAGFNIIEAIRSLEDLYIEGGGHPMAAGFSIQTAKIEMFTRRIKAVAVPLLTEEILTKKLKIDTEISFNQINFELLKAIQLFEPTGLGNPTPTFVARKVNVVDARVVGRDGAHLKLRLEKDDISFDAIAFGAGALFKKLTPGGEVDVVYSLEEDTWGQVSRLQLKVKDVKISE